MKLPCLLINFCSVAIFNVLKSALLKGQWVESSPLLTDIKARLPYNSEENLPKEFEDATVRHTSRDDFFLEYWDPQIKPPSWTRSGKSILQSSVDKDGISRLESTKRNRREARRRVLDKERQRKKETNVRVNIPDHWKAYLLGTRYSTERAMSNVRTTTVATREYSTTLLSGTTFDPEENEETTLSNELDSDQGQDRWSQIIQTDFPETTTFSDTTMFDPDDVTLPSNWQPYLQPHNETHGKQTLLGVSNPENFISRDSPPKIWQTAQDIKTSLPNVTSNKAKSETSSSSVLIPGQSILKPPKSLIEEDNSLISSLSHEPNSPDSDKKLSNLVQFPLPFQAIKSPTSNPFENLISEQFMLGFKTSGKIEPTDILKAVYNGPLVNFNPIKMEAEEAIDKLIMQLKQEMQSTRGNEKRPVLVGQDEKVKYSDNPWSFLFPINRTISTNFELSSAASNIEINEIIQTMEKDLSIQTTQSSFPEKNLEEDLVDLTFYDEESLTVDVPNIPDNSNPGHLNEIESESENLLRVSQLELANSVQADQLSLQSPSASDLTTQPPTAGEILTSVLSQSAAPLAGLSAASLVYGAAALLPLWLPLAIGKRRKKRNLSQPKFSLNPKEIVLR